MAYSLVHCFAFSLNSGLLHLNSEDLDNRNEFAMALMKIPYCFKTFKHCIKDCTHLIVKRSIFIKTNSKVKRKEKMEIDKKQYNKQDDKNYLYLQTVQLFAFIKILT